MGSGIPYRITLPETGSAQWPPLRTFIFRHHQPSVRIPALSLVTTKAAAVVCPAFPEAHCMSDSSDGLEISRYLSHAIGSCLTFALTRAIGRARYSGSRGQGTLH